MTAACVPGGVQTSTTSTSLRSMTWRQSVTHDSMPHARDTVATASALRPDITTGVKTTADGRMSGAARYAYAWARPIMP